MSEDPANNHYCDVRRAWWLVGTLNTGGWIIARMDEDDIPNAVVVDVGPFADVEAAHRRAHLLAGCWLDV